MHPEQFEVVVKSIEVIAPDIVVIELGSPDGSLLPEFDAGAHIDVQVSPNVLRQYSLCDGPAHTDRYRIAVKLERPSRGGSVAMHGLAPGQLLRIGAPRNNFRLAEGAQSHILIAGGIGITPLLSMAHRLQTTGQRYSLHYFARSRENAAFADVLSAAPFGQSTCFHLTNDKAVVEEDLRRVLSTRDESHLYICGPGPMIKLAEDIAAPAWPPDRVHIERFSAAPPPANKTSSTFRVRLARSNFEIEVPEGISIIEAIRNAGFMAVTSCEAGICGTCLTTVLEGEPDHLDEYLTSQEKKAGDKMMICVSRAKSPLLVLDL